MRSIGLTASLAAVVLAAPHSVIAQEDNVYNIDLDAQIGFESLEEPAEAASGAEAAAGQLLGLDTNAYVTVNATALVQASNLQAFIQAPLRFNVDGFELRKEDWDEPSEILRIFRCARIDIMVEDGVMVRPNSDGSCRSWTPDEAVGSVSSARSDFLYLSARLAPLDNYSLGYGSIVSGYDAMLEEDHFRDGVTLEMNINRALVFSGALSDVTSPTVAAGRIAFRPVQNSASTSGGYGQYGAYEAPEDLDFFVEIGVTAASDLSAPATFDAETGQVTSERAVTIGGVDARIRLTEESTATMEGYEVMRFELGTEFNQILDFQGALHNHLRFYYDVGSVDFFIDGEHRMLMGQYIPNYFNQHYRIQRTQFALSDDQRALVEGEATLTKRGVLEALPDTTEHGFATTATFRFWADAGTGSGWNRAADLWVFAEQTPGRDLSGRAGAGISLYGLDDKLDITALFVQQGWDTLDGLFALDRSILEVAARYMLDGGMYLDFFFDQTFFLLPDESGFDTANDFGVNLGFLSDVE